MTQRWKAENILLSVVCFNINLVKPFKKYAHLSVENTAKTLNALHIGEM